MSRARIVSMLVAVAAAAVAFQLGGRLSEERRLSDAQRLALDGRPAAALERLEGIGRGPTASRAHALRAALAARSLDWEGAARELRRALRRDPNDWELRMELALALLFDGDRQGAKRNLERALALNPRLPPLPGFTVSRG